MKKIITFLLVAVMLSGCAPSEQAFKEPVKEPPVINLPNEPKVPVEEVVEEYPEDMTDDVPLDFVFPLIKQSGSGYALMVGDEIVSPIYDGMAYIENTRYVQGESEEGYDLINIDTYSIRGPYDYYDKDNALAEFGAGSITSFYDNETYNYGYVIDGIKGEERYSYTSPFVDGYSVMAQGDTFKVVDVDFTVQFEHDVKIVSYGRGFFGTVVDFALYDDYYNQVMLVDVTGKEIAGPFFEIDVIDDNLFFVSNHEESWFIDGEGNRVKDDILDIMAINNNEEAMNFDGYLVIFHSRGDYNNYTVYTMDGEKLYVSESSDETECEGFGDGFIVCQNEVSNDRFLKVTLPVLKQEGSGDLFESVNQYIKDNYTLMSYDTIEEVWDIREIDYTARRTGVGIMEYDMFYYYYGFGAAHPNYAQHTEHINLFTGEIYTFRSLLKSDESIGVVTELLQKKASEMEDIFFDISEVTAYENISFRMLEDGIAFYYDPYEVAPYAAGMPKIILTYDEMADVIDFMSPFFTAFRPVG